MKIKCRGYYGKLISLYATEDCARVRNLLEFSTVWYDIEIRTEDGAKISLSRVKKNEIEEVVVE